jgi:hypothetical protein
VRGIDIALLVIVFGCETDPIIIVAHHILVPAQRAQVSCISYICKKIDARTDFWKYFPGLAHKCRLLPLFSVVCAQTRETFGCLLTFSPALRTERKIMI